MDDWKETGMRGDYYKMVHIPCGAKVVVLIGHEPICPTCQPEESAAQKRRDGF